MTSRPVIAVSLGDPYGIGPEITVRALAEKRLRKQAVFWICGCPQVLERTAAKLGIEPFWWDGLRDRDEDPEAFDVRVYGKVVRLPALATPGPTREGGAASLGWVRDAIAIAKGEVGELPRAGAIVTAPISKEAWHAAGISYPGHTELLGEAFESPRSGMLFVGKRLRVILVTIHVPLREVPGRVTRGKVFDAIELGERACRDLGVKKPRVAVAGINPHAGEGGLFGDEEAREVTPAVEQARAAGLDVSGPLPGDAVFLAAAEGRYDLVVAMYHDQGLIPVKLLERKDAVNVTVGLAWQGRRVVRTSPAHGTAYDIAGKGIADAASMRAAIELAVQMAAAG